MPGGFNLNPPAIPLARPVAQLAVYRVNDLTTPPEYELLPNLRCLSYHILDGADPGSARLRYAFGDLLGDPDDPQRIEDVFPIDAKGQGVIHTDDLIAVTRVKDDGSEDLLFSGYAQLPQADLGPKTESCTFECLATPIREFDKPLKGAIYRNADNPSLLIDVQTDLPARFNPDGKPNMCLDAVRSGTAPSLYSVFVDVNVVRDPEIRAAWTLPRAVESIQQWGNADELYVTNCTSLSLDATLISIEPAVDGGFIDLDDDTTYTVTDIIVPDVDVTGEPWPVAIEKLIKPHGFGMRWELAWDADKTITWTLKIFDASSIIPRKSIFLQEAGETYDPTKTNTGGLSLSRDRHSLFNEVVVDTQPARYEASFILAAGFLISTGDELPANNVNFKEGSTNFYKDTYRMFHFGEAGDPWVTNIGDPLVVKPFRSLDRILGSPGPDVDAAGNPIAKYAARRRKPIGDLFTKDPSKKPLKAELWVSKDYVPNGPEVFDPSKTATWEKVVSGWELLPDRIGIRITVADPMSLDTGARGANAIVSQAGKLDIVTGLANPNSAKPKFYFRLTCVIEGDQGLEATAHKRVASPTGYTIQRRDDARDRFKHHVISKYSHNNAVGNFDVDDVNDTDIALDHADARRRAHDKAVFAGTVTMRKFTTAFKRGDKISDIRGRGLSLQTNSGVEQGESVAYSVVDSITCNFDGDQTTTLHLTDRRADPPRRRTT